MASKIFYIGEKKEDMTMDHEKLFNQTIKAYKTSFDNAFSTIAIFQDQTEQMMNIFLESNPCIPEEGKKAILDWAKSYKKSREDYKTAVDESYKKLEDFLNKINKSTAK
jgi:hypothetical protein